MPGAFGGYQLALGPGIAHDRRGIVRKDAGHRRQVANVAVDDAEEGGNGGLVRGDRIEIARGATSIECNPSLCRNRLPFDVQNLSEAIWPITRNQNWVIRDPLRTRRALSIDRAPKRHDANDRLIDHKVLFSMPLRFSNQATEGRNRPVPKARTR